MIKVTKAYRDLMAKHLDETARPIRPLVGTCKEGHKEYGDAIADWSQIKSTYTDRLSPSAGMFANPAHGPTVYNDLTTLIVKLNVTSVLDLGCGGCDFLSELVNAGLKKKDLFGCTIHIGECVVAHAKGYPNVAPIDMREIDIYYQPHSFDCVVASWSFQHLKVVDRVEVVEKALDLLTPTGVFIGRDYYSQPITAIPVPSKAIIVAAQTTRFGNITVMAAA